METTDARNSPQTDEDLTTRARIRNAALSEFATHGFRGASIRAIARAAGVSAGLVQHHFATKDGLRQACDSYVMQYLTEVHGRISTNDGSISPELLIERLDEVQPLIDYLVMSLASGSDTASQWFEQIAEYVHHALLSGLFGHKIDPNLDTRAIAATQAAMVLGITAFYGNIRHTLGVTDPAELFLRVGRARLFLTSERIMSEENREKFARALHQYERVRATGKPPPASHDPDASA